MQYLRPNFDVEWEEAIRYPEFEKMGKDNWIEYAKKNFQILHYSSIKDNLGNVDLDYDNLDDQKKNRFEKSYKEKTIEIPLAVKFSDDEYDLIGGNTRLSGLVKHGKNPKLWVIDMENIQEVENLKGGLSDGKTLKDVAKKHKMDAELLNVQLQNGIKVEKEEHTNNKKSAKEIALDHLWEDPTYYIKLKKADIEEKNNPYEDDNDKDDVFPNGSSDWRKKKEVKEMGADAGGSFEAPLFSTIKRKINEEGGIGGSGSYDVPAFGKTSRGGRKNPLKIDGPDSIYKGRAVKDKNFPKWGGPDSIFVKIKEKCKKFPYCNQGDTGALEFIHEDEDLKRAIEEACKLYNLRYEDVEKVVINEIKKIFI